MPRSFFFATIWIVVTTCPATAPFAATRFEAPFVALDEINLPRSVAAADLDGDGRLDLVTTNSGAGVVSVRRGLGGGAYGPRLDFPSGASPEDLAVADFDLDGRLDVAVTNRMPSTVSFLRGNGDGTLQSPTSFATATGPGPMSVGDLDGNGALDLVIAIIGLNSHYPYYSFGSKVSVLLGNGNGTFQPRSDITIGSGTEDVAIGHLNGDAWLDLAVAAGGVKILLGNGDGTFAAPTSLASSSGYRILCVDLDADGQLDLAVGNRSNFILSVFRGNGNGTFAARVDHGPSSYPGGGLVAADLNADGHLDIAATESQGDEVVVLIGDGTGNFMEGEEFVAGNDPVALLAADLDADGVVDLAVADGLGRKLALFHGNGDATFGGLRQFPVGTAPMGFDLGDMDGDGDLDAVMVAYFAPCNVLVLPGSGGGFGAPIAYELGAPNNQDLRLVDMNQDGRLDVVGAAHYFGALFVMLSNTDGSLEEATYFGAETWPNSFALADLNADGLLDATVQCTSENNVMSLLAQGDGTFGWAKDAGLVASNVDVGDINGDGRPDLAAARGTFVTVRPGNGDGTFGPGWDVPTGSGTSDVAVTDLNADGLLDLVAGPGAGAVTVFLNAGGGAFLPGVSYPAGPGSDIEVLELNADGSLDLVTLNTASNTVSVLLGTGGGTFAAEVEYGTGGSPAAVRAGDVNGDGRLDLVTSDFEGSTLSVLLGTDTPTDVPLAATRHTRLQSGFPNPARGSLTVQFFLAERGATSVRVYDVSGRIVRRLVEGMMPAGAHAVGWNRLGSDGRRVAAGVYFCELRTGTTSDSRRLVLVD